MNWRRALRALWVLGGLSFSGWIYFGFQAGQLPPGTFSDTATVRVESASGGWLFRPIAAEPPTELVFLPGGLVEPAAYAPFLRRIAEAGFRARLLPLPWRCACTESQRAELFDNITRQANRRPIVLAGHSRGAMLAASYAHQNPARVAALGLLATTHPRDFSLRQAAFPIVKIYATNDGVAAYSAMQANAHLLPEATRWTRIDGGNHVQFAHYRHQLMSGKATLSRDAQQAQAAGALLTLLHSVNAGVQRAP